MKLRLALLFSVFLYVSCQTNPSTDNEELVRTKTGRAIIEDEKSEDFTRFLNKFKILRLPIIINPTEQQDVSHLPIIFDRDMAFINTPYKDTSLDKIFAYGLLPDTTKTIISIFANSC